MFRNTSSIKNRIYINSLKYCKSNFECTPNVKNGNIELLFGTRHFSNVNGFLNNLKISFVHFTNRTLGKNEQAVQSIPDECRVLKLKNNKNRLLKKDIQSQLANITKIGKNKVLWTSAGITVASKDNINLESAINLTQPTESVIKSVSSKSETSQSQINETVLDPPSIEPIPEPPPVVEILPDESVEVINQLNALGEPTFASLGLGGYSPVGLVQNCLEYVHVTLGVDWWAAIVIGTIVIRFALFPLVIIAQRNAARMNNHLPQMQIIQMKMTEARQTGNAMEAARYSQELMLFMKEKGLNPFKNMIVPMAQMPVFLSFFMSLRQMANVPVESLTTGGLWWFTDLTVPDQYLLMPIITSLTLWATIELGTDSAKLSSQNMQFMKYALRAMPIVVFPFTLNFPGVVLCYWVSSNFISLIQVGILRIPTVRDYFKIDPLISHNPEKLPIKPKGFREGIKDSWTNIKITKELEERRRLDEIQFQRAGKGPIIKTYKYDPTKQTNPTATTPISAKKR